jgi:FKBP-type peptidyl-prolyl cis-trans isomerase FklB
MISSGVKEINFADFTDGLKAILTGSKPAISFDEANAALDAFFNKLEKERAAKAQGSKKEGEDFLSANASRDGVKVLPSGLQYKVIKEGDGKKPGPHDKVRCHYEGKFIDGRKFDSSYDRGEPAVFGVDQVIRGWTQALQMMTEGSVWELYIPYQLGYGETGAQGAIPPYSALVFRVELIKVL